MIRPLSLLAAAFAVLTPVLYAQPAAGPERADVITLFTGASVPCRILETTPTRLRIEYAPPGGVGVMVREVPWADVRSVDFAMDEEFRNLVEGKNPAPQMTRLQARWVEVQPLLDRPNHPAGALGLSFARACLAGGQPPQLSRALEVCDAVATTDWNAGRRAWALVVKAEVLLARKEPAQAVNDLDRLLKEKNLEPAVATHAWLLLGQTHFASLKALEEEHPRWQDDDAVLPDRQRLFHEAVENFLRPSLFAGSLEGPAASGIWQAVAVLAHDRDIPAAADAVRDLIQLYPTSPQAAEGQAWLTQQKLPLRPATETVAPAPGPVPDKKAAPAEKAAPEPEASRRKRYVKPGGDTVNPPSIP
ncbi:hypothetical protein [Verrucomicrobium spinosum]|uniref:hypothetical protein n=1 Tax=Verrucomicrobium spinosum TaxID=2736 RepID=UPI000174616B|nr:hypothetical protein [Verrucomicrobium spinosum]